MSFIWTFWFSMINDDISLWFGYNKQWSMAKMKHLLCSILSARSWATLKWNILKKILQPELPKRCERWGGDNLIPLWQCQHVWPPWWAPTSPGEPSNITQSTTNITHVILWHREDQLFHSTFDRNVRQLPPFELREEVENKVQKSFDLRLPSNSPVNPSALFAADKA